MDYLALERKRALYLQGRDSLPEITAASYEQAFAIEYTHNSTAIEGNTLTLIETKVVLEDQLSIGGKQLREIYEVINHDKALRYVKDRIAQGTPLDEKTVKDIHALLMANIMVGGVYRSVDVYISGARHTPPTPNEMYRQIKDFYADLGWRGDGMDPITLAAWTHAEFVKIHPFADGNGRTSRLLMNYQLMAAGFLPVSIAKEDRLAYFNTLEAYAVDGDLVPFTDMIAALEEVQLDRYLAMIEQSQGMDQSPSMG